MNKKLATLAILCSIVLAISTISVIAVTAAETATIQLKATIIPAISFTVDKTLLDFGQLAPGDKSKDQKLEITNDGSKDLTIMAEVSDNDGNLFATGLEIDNDKWSDWSLDLRSGKSKDAKVQLNVPADFSGSGEKEGTLTLWAEASESSDDESDDE